jgi:hypothetical protein
MVAHALPDDVYLSAEQVQYLKTSLRQVEELNRRLRLRIAYAWEIDLDKYYSTCDASRSCLCDLPYARLDIQTDGRMAVCVSGKQVGEAGRDSIAGVWHGELMTEYRKMYERTRPMPMCFRAAAFRRRSGLTPSRW